MPGPACVAWHVVTDAESAYLGNIELFITRFLGKLRLLRALDDFRAAVSEDVRDAVESEISADLHLIAESAADWCGCSIVRRA